MGTTLDRSARTLVLGGRGLVGGAILRHLGGQGFSALLAPTRAELDLTRQADVERFFARERPRHVLLAAAKVGGIAANSARPAEFIRENLAIETNVVHAAHEHGVERLLFLGSSCIYPKHAPQPIREEALLTGPLEPTNEAYAVAKIAGLALCQAYQRQFGARFVAAMPTNLYGPGDNFDLETSHVLPAMLRKLHEAKEDGHRPVVLWGTGTPRRELLHVDDLAAACLVLLERHEGPLALNVGTGEDVELRELARLVQEVVGHRGEVRWDTSRPDGTPRKVLDVSRLRALGWAPRIPLRAGIEETYRWFLAHRADARGAVSSPG